MQEQTILEIAENVLASRNSQDIFSKAGKQETPMYNKTNCIKLSSLTKQVDYPVMNLPFWTPALIQRGPITYRLTNIWNTDKRLCKIGLYEPIGLLGNRE